ncbi:hypothetical protein [Stenotrophomonas sp.]|uniref:hypothetical protein n=1 Tax=Stenotrophomonas sp. TaxID=69392 RepID=UPI0028A9E437|nr:hypothetical protein [Stenotrophomonas sp.]
MRVPEIGAGMIPHPLEGGKIYDVLAMYAWVGGARKFRVLTNESRVGPESVGVFDESLFEKVCDVRPPNWSDKAFGDMVESAPSAWQEERFWEHFYDGDPDAQRSFERELQEMVDEGR